MTIAEHGFLTDSSVGVWLRGVEIDRVPRFENVVFRSDVELKLPAKDRYELGSGMVMLASLSRLQRMEFSVIGV